MSLTCSSVGDIISVSLLVKVLVIALDDARGSSAEYQSIIRELYFLDSALLRVEQLQRTSAPSPEIEALRDTAHRTVEKCRECIQPIQDSIAKYKKSLSPTGSGSTMKDAARKIQWKAEGKHEEVAKFRAELTGYTESINMLLSTMSM